MADAHRGACELCVHQAAKSLMAGHVATCPAEQDSGSRPSPLVQLHIESEGMPEYWLYVEGRETALLQQLDLLLRRVWLECCGHMSAFRLGRLELNQRTPLSALPRKGIAFQYEYDFGSTTALEGRVLSLREGSIGRGVIRLLARNNPPRLTCSECEAPATLVCPYCIQSEAWLFCEEHAPQHPCAEEEVFMPTVNSPRMGVCGYTG